MFPGKSRETQPTHMPTCCTSLRPRLTILFHEQVEAVMLECTGAPPRSLSTSPPAPLGPAYYSSSGTPASRPPPPPSSIASERNNATMTLLKNGCLDAPTLKNGCLDPSTRMTKTDTPSLTSSADNLTSTPTTLESGGSRTERPTEGEDPVILSAREITRPHPPPPHLPLPRNLVLDFGDFVGKRGACGTLNRAAAFGESRVDPRAVVAVERAAIEMLQNPRLVSGIFIASDSR